MKRIIALTTATLMGASMLAVPAIAQVSVGADADIGISGSADTSGGTMSSDTDADIKLKSSADTDVDTGTTAAIGTTFDGALAAINNNTTASSAISAMTDVRNVDVIWIKDLEGANMDVLAEAETSNQAAIEDLRASLESNAAVNSALEAESVDPSTVVAADVSADGMLTVYVR